MTDRTLEEQIKLCLTDTQTEWGSSRASTFRRCPEEHRLNYVERITPNYWRSGEDETPEYFSVGRLGHAALHYLHIGGDPQDLINYCYARDDGTDLGLVYEAERLVQAYLAHYAVVPGGIDEWHVRCGWPEGTEFIAAELGLEDRGTFAVPETRRVDLVVRMGSAVVGVDHKFRASKVPGSSVRGNPGGDAGARDRYVRGLRTKPALIGQSWLLQQHFGLSEPPAMMLNVVVKTKIPSFTRVLVPITQQDVDRWIEVRRSEAIMQAQTVLTVVPNWDNCAPEIGGRCRYFSWCHGSEEERAAHYLRDGEPIGVSGTPAWPKGVES